MTIIHKYIELALFLILNIFLSSNAAFLPGLPTIEKFHPNIVLVLILLFGSFFFKFIIFEKLRKQAFLPFINSILNKILTDKKFFGIVIFVSAISDIIFGIQNQTNDKSLDVLNIINIFISSLIAGVTFSYFGYWSIKQLKKFKRMFLKNNRLSIFHNLILFEIVSPVIYCIFFTGIFIIVFCCISKTYEREIITMFEEIYATPFLLMTASGILAAAIISIIISIITSNKQNKNTKAEKRYILKIAKIFGISEYFIYILSQTIIFGFLLLLSKISTQ